jgi:hypothetical protein|tara:strand:- start:216 stop:359 length:144 start_codon:yes stop_codon:yes gene_type:complete
MLTCVKELKLSINAIGISITRIIKNNAGDSNEYAFALSLLEYKFRQA